MPTVIDGTNGVTFPAGGLGNPAGAVVGTTDTQALTNKTLTSPIITGASMSSMASSVITSGTAVASTSGTSIDFTGIPSWAKRITVMLNGVSTNGTANIWLQIGAGSIETTGYTTNAGRVSGASCTTFASISTAFIVSSTSAASDTQNGTLILSTLGSNAWTFTGTCLNPNGPMIHYLAGVKTTSGALDRVRVTTSNGTDIFDAGSINILYE